jgi:hypothetical protein
MKKTLFAFALLFTIAQSCESSGQKNALDFNNKIANITLANQDKWKELGQEINIAQQSHDYTKLSGMTTDLISFLDQKIAEVDAMKIPESTEDLKNATLDFLKFDRSIAEEKAKPYTKMNEQTTPEEFKNVTQALFAQANLEEPYHTKMIEAQRAFAKKNGFRIEETKEK